MDLIPSFAVDHTRIVPGIYVSRIDKIDEINSIVTYDIRMKIPNKEPAIHTASMHSIEHLVATFLRNHPEFKNYLIYWGPMGCCTGNYLLVQGEAQPAELLPLLRDTFRFISEFDGEVPGASARDCGNYLLMNLPEARFVARKYLGVLESEDCPTLYP